MQKYKQRKASWEAKYLSVSIAIAIPHLVLLYVGDAKAHDPLQEAPLLHNLIICRRIIFFGECRKIERAPKQDSQN